MAEFTEVWKQWQRMCRAREDCEGCRLRELKCNIEFPCNQKKYAPEVIEDIVMKWAEENPEKVYPTWWKYMCMIGVIPNTLGDKTLGEVTVERLMNINIPADIAEKLGLEPKEG